MQLCDIDEWVKKAQESSVIEIRQAIHTVIVAVSNSIYLRDRMLIKGGVLLAIRFQGVRFTKDIDFSTYEQYAKFDEEMFLRELSDNLLLAVENLPYDLDCRIQSKKLAPAKGGNFPTLQIKIGYAYKGTVKHKRLLAGICPDVLQIDYSFNEHNCSFDYLEIQDDKKIKAYCIEDLVAEKYRALLQQKVRNRIRRQDAYDLYWLIENGYLNSVSKKEVLNSLILKSNSRNLFVTKESISDIDIRARSEKEYITLTQDIEGELPYFEKVYNKVAEYYQSLPW